jgi:tRNA(Ile)-lysidine synthase
MNIKKSLTELAKEQELLSPGDRVLVAVSGGPDSVALLDVLSELRDELGLYLEVAHLQHGIRGEEANEDARFVAALAESLNVAFHVKDVSIPEIKKSAGKGNLEALAREERYRFFTALAQERNLNKIATAHTLDDQAETVLMWFLRGCGTKGLAGMSPLHDRACRDAGSVPAPALIRPLLGVSKAEILDYLEERQRSYRVDKTNQDPALLRNWIRLELLPHIAERIDSHWPQRLARQAALLRDEDIFMDRLARIELDKLRASTGLDRKLLACQDPALQRRILRLWIAENRGHLRGLDFSHIEQLLDMAARGAPNARLSIPGGWELANVYESVRLEKRSRTPKDARYSYSFRAGEVLHIPEAGIALASKRISVPPAAAPCMPVGLDEALFDVALLSENLTVRNFCPGDRYQPLGMKGHKKVKDLFIEKKAPLSVRSVLPLFSMGDEILWVPAYARSETAKIGPQTKEILHIKAVLLER